VTQSYPGDRAVADSILSAIDPTYRAMGLHDGFEVVNQFLEAYYASDIRSMNEFGQQWAAEHTSEETPHGI
jgi:hypothetical protein